MRRVFADAGYWIALILPEDDWHEAAKAAAAALAGVHLITTDEVLAEFLAFFSAFSANMRRAAAQMVRRLLEDPYVEVLPQSRDSFLSGVALYERRLDKEYSLQDCTSFAVMKSEQVHEVLTPDDHFAQEGFVLLLRR